ncbi:MAG: DUF6279 family lipoprotein [Pseudomonadales bacterium]|nr:DUF6279 family lipoprotein [Pseudomonadales bacterium]
MIIFVFVLQGCAVKFVYNQLDWAIPWYLSDYMSLDGDQEDQFDERLAEYLKWHRQTQLPLYGDFLNQVADKLEQGMTESSIIYVQDRTQALGQVLIERLVPDMVMLFGSASDDQVVALFEKFAEDNQEYREEYIDVSERAQRKLRAKEVQKYIERWTGRLSDDQLALIREGTQQYYLMGAEFLQARLAWQQEFRRILEGRDEKPSFEKALSGLLLSEGYGRSDSFETKLDHNKKILLQLYLKLDSSLTERQRAKAVKKLRGYSEDFHDLSKQS